MEKQIRQVREFMCVFEQEMYNKPTIPSYEGAKLRYDLIKEELDEMKEAIELGDMVALADAFADILYVVYGGIVLCGLDKHMPTVFDEVHMSNMSKLGDDGRPIKNASGKGLKGPNYFPPNIKAILDGGCGAECCACTLSSDCPDARSA